MKEKIPAPISHLTDAVRKMLKYSRGKTELVYVAETFTKTYNQYNAKNLKSFCTFLSHSQHALSQVISTFLMPLIIIEFSLLPFQLHHFFQHSFIIFLKKLKIPQTKYSI
jgi:hypothetical protein